ncbi:hypothetical protein B0H10DRAFT_1951271 [Mycena sp. CBHHK59/15]|nr:hypothetical protein B0H10DRAFT_1951271 [Mycena sp. CBHHK59/15]
MQDGGLGDRAKLMHSHLVPPAKIMPQVPKKNILRSVFVGNFIGERETTSAHHEDGMGLAKATEWWMAVGIALRLAVQMEEHLDARAQSYQYYDCVPAKQNSQPNIPALHQCAAINATPGTAKYPTKNCGTAHTTAAH